MFPLASLLIPNILFTWSWGFNDNDNELSAIVTLSIKSNSSKLTLKIALYIAPPKLSAKSFPYRFYLCAGLLVYESIDVGDLPYL